MYENKLFILLPNLIQTKSKKMLYAEKVAQSPESTMPPHIGDIEAIIKVGVYTKASELAA